MQMTMVAEAVRGEVRAPVDSIRIALLGLGQVGGAVAALVRDSGLNDRFTIACGLVRDVRRERPDAAHLRLTSDTRDALTDDPHVVIEALGGLEPARTLVVDALERGIPVVTANKSLLAAHGRELLDLSARLGVPFRYEAAVLAGVPFLGTFARRPLARRVCGVCGIVNGTTNFILSKMADQRVKLDIALREAQRRGYAEPDPRNDLNGIDAAEKLTVLLHHFGDWNIRTSEIATDGISGITENEIRAAAELGGTIKPIVYADWSEGTLTAFCGPAFVPGVHPLARVNGVQNAVLLRKASGDLFFAGPGAGPEVTAGTLLDDASEIAWSGTPLPRRPQSEDSRHRVWRAAVPKAPASDCFIRLVRPQSLSLFELPLPDPQPPSASACDML
jgi:homoserine dehydrogenase